jgi:hypothetical protein
LPAPPADAGVVWPTRQRGAAVVVTLTGRAWASPGVAAAVWFGRWSVGPLGGDDRVELGPQQLLVGADQLQELLVGAARR